MDSFLFATRTSERGMARDGNMGSQHSSLKQLASFWFPSKAMKRGPPFRENTLPLSGLVQRETKDRHHFSAVFIA